jgi:hypothetical protein
MSDSREPGLTGQELQALRQSVGMPSAEFAKQAGYDYGYYRSIEASEGQVNVSIKFSFKRILLSWAKDQANLLESWDPGVSKLDIRSKNDATVRLSRKGVSSD